MIPDNRIPFIYVDFDNSKAIPTDSAQIYNHLLIGQKLDAAPGPTEMPVSVRSEQDVSDLFGSGSMLHFMAQGYFKNNNSSKCYAIALSDPKNSTPSQWSITTEGIFSNNITLPLFIAGKRVEAVVTRENQGQILQALSDILGSDPTFPVTSSIKDNILYLTAKNKGEYAGKIDIRTDFGVFRQPAQGIKLKVQQDPNQVGMGSCVLEGVIRKIYDKQFHLIVNPYTDPDNLKLLDEDLVSRFSAERQMEGHLFSAIGGDEAFLKAWSLYHSKHFTILPSGVSSPTPDWVWAAAFSGVIGTEGQIDPARPFNTLPMYGCVPDEDGKRFERSVRARLLGLGYSSYNVDFNGIPRIEKPLTTYLNPSAPSDESYLLLNTLLTLSRLRFSFCSYFASKYPRHKLADDDAVIQPGSAILTPNTARCEAIALFRSWEEEGWVEGFEQFKSDLYVERNKMRRDRLDFFMSPRLISQLNIIGAKVSFLL